MAKTFEAPFVQSGQMTPVRYGTLDTSLDGSGTYSAAMVTGAAEGTRIQRILFIGEVTTTVGYIRVYSNNGSAVALVGEVPVTVFTPSNILPTWTGQLVFPEPFIVASGKWLKFAPTKSEMFVGIPFAADY